MNFQELKSKMNLWTTLLAQGLVSLESFREATTFILQVYDRGIK